MDIVSLLLARKVTAGSGGGESAYDIAKKNGFEGTEQEWLESLKSKVEIATEDEISKIIAGEKFDNSEKLVPLKVLPQFYQGLHDEFVEEEHAITNNEIDMLSIPVENKTKNIITLTNKALNGGEIDIVNDIEVPENNAQKVIFKNDAVVNFYANKIKLLGNWGTNEKNNSRFYIDKSEVIVDGTTGGIETEGNFAHCFNVTNGGILIINGGHFTGGATAVFVDKGTAIINGGTFKSNYKFPSNNAPWTLNCNDANYKAGTAKIIVRGGLFVNWNPANPGTNDAPTYIDVSGGYYLKMFKKGNDTYYAVLKK